MNQQASTLAGPVSHVFIYIVVLSAIFLVGLTATMIAFVVKYSRGRNAKPVDIHGHTGLEILWTVIPTLLFMTMFYYGYTRWSYGRNAPKDSLQVTVTGRQWSYAFAYPNGKESAELKVPLGRPVRCNLVATDVLHGFFIPAFAVKQDMVPGKNNYTWFQASETGTYDILCTVFCGEGHPKMLAKVVVLPPAEFDAWYAAREAESGPEHGAALYKTKGCVGCHSLDGSKLVGPSWKGIFGEPAVVVTGGVERTVTTDEAYLKRSIREPNADVVKGYQPGMMPVEMSLTDADVDDLVAYIKTLK